MQCNTTRNMFVLWFTISCMFQLIICEDIPRGHMQPIGSHKDSDGHIDILEQMPTPQSFWDNYVKIGKPALLKGAASAMPAMGKWTDEYLIKKYGHLMVKLESKREKSHTPEGVKGVGQDTIKNFVETYKMQDKYIVSQLPDPMTADVAVPQCVLCGSFRDRILEADIWMSSGNTTSLLHGDVDNALNCLLYGTKNWILIDPVYEKNIPIAIEGGHPIGGFSVLNVDKMDLLRYPEFKDVPWQYANVSAGDCLFLPKGHQHQVRSYGRNIAVSILIARLDEFEPYGCPDDDLPRQEKLSEIPLVWTYDGYSHQTMGNVDPFTLNDSFIEYCENSSNEFVGKDYLMDGLVKLVDISEDRYTGSLQLKKEEWQIPEHNMKIINDRANQALELISPGSTEGLSCKKLSVLTVDVLKKLADILDPSMQNDADYEFLDIESKVVKDMIEWSMVLSVEKFKKIYKKSGSGAGADWIISTLDKNKDGTITAKEVKSNLDTVLERFKEDKVLIKQIQDTEILEQLDNLRKSDQNRPAKNHEEL